MKNSGWELFYNICVLVIYLCSLVVFSQGQIDKGFYLLGASILVQLISMKYGDIN